jgi:hypothetical protein
MASSIVEGISLKIMNALLAFTEIPGNETVRIGYQFIAFGR